LERMVCDLSIGLHDAGHSVAVFSVGGLGVNADRLWNAGVPVHDCTEGKLRIRGLPLRLVRAIRRFRPDAIHAHSGTWLPAAVTSLFQRSAAVVYTEHGRYFPEPPLRALLDGWCNRRTRSLVTVSADLAAYLQRFLRLPATPIVIRNGVDLTMYTGIDDLDRRGIRDSWAAGPKDVVGICVARYVPVKNHALLIDAFSGCAATTERIRLVFYGEGPLEAELRSRVADLRLDDRLRFCEFSRQIHRSLAAADFFVLSSESEGLPLALLEALAAGLPVIATDVGGIADALGKPPAGILVESGDLPGLSRAIARLAADTPLRTHLSELARNRARGFSLAAMVERYVSTYQAAMARE
ncbi:MAG: glycosyltransferase, partial [Gemmatimonadales bacterium]|nr:glycosyltransferase [Gemmatimonadales bacterium]